jgi:hypothetical protein
MQLPMPPTVPVPVLLGSDAVPDIGDYHELGAEFLDLARKIDSPEIRAIYLSLASGYHKLAQFHEQIRPIVDAANGVEIDSAWASGDPAERGTLEPPVR